MALEDELKRLNANIEKQNGFMEKMLAGATVPKTSTATTTSGTGKPAGTKAAGTKAKEISVEDLGAKAQAYVKGHSDRDEAKANIVKISTKFGAERFTAIAAEHRAEALSLLAQYEAGEDPLADESGDEGDDPEI